MKTASVAPGPEVSESMIADARGVLDRAAGYEDDLNRLAWSWTGDPLSFEQGNKLKQEMRALIEKTVARVLSNLGERNT